MSTAKVAPKATADQTCKQITALVYDYCNDALASPIKRAFERHLRLCPDCVSFLKTYRKTVRTTRWLRASDIPPGVRDSLWSFLERRMR
jgi:hypothetical protein